MLIYGEKFTLERTIHFDVKGYLNSYVDEKSNAIYILVEDDPDIGNITFIVADLSTGEIIESKALSFRIPILQDIEMHNEFIYVLSGFGTDDYPNYIHKINRDGVLIELFDVKGLEELEGLSFVDNRPVIATLHHIYYEQ